MYHIIGFYLFVALQAYVVYMGSKSSEDPNDTLSHNHQILAAVHGGRSLYLLSFLFYIILICPFHLLYCFALSFLLIGVCGATTIALSKHGLLTFIVTNMVLEALLPS